MCQTQIWNQNLDLEEVCVTIAVLGHFEVTRRDLFNLGSLDVENGPRQMYYSRIRIIIIIYLNPTTSLNILLSQYRI